MKMWKNTNKKQKFLTMLTTMRRQYNSLLLGRKSMKTYTKKQRHYFADKGPYSQSYGFFSSHVQMWGLNHKEDWALKSWCFQTVVLGKTLESPLDCKEIKPVKPKGNQPWIFIGRTNAEAPVLWPPDEKSWLTGKDWCWERMMAREGGDRG